MSEAEKPLPETLVLAEPPTPLYGRPAIAASWLFRAYGADIMQRLINAGRLEWVSGHNAAWLNMPWEVRPK